MLRVRACQRRVPAVRYSPEQKTRNRERILDAAGALIKLRGFAATGVDALMAASGLTAGAFYSNFRSKAEFLGALVDREMGGSVSRFEVASAAEAKACFAAYLSRAHVEQPEQGCVLPALSAEVARSDETVRGAFERRLLEVHAGTVRQTRDEALAWSLLAQAVGGVMLARAVQSPDTRRSILKSLRTCIDEAIDAHESRTGSNT